MPWPTGSGRKASIPRLLPRLAGQWRFLPALSIDGLGYVLMVLALPVLPVLPVFVVQAAVAASLVVTAIAATRFIGATLTGREWAAVAVVWVGLGLLGMSSGAEGPGHAGGAFRAGLVAVVLLGVAGGLAPRPPDRWAAPVLGLGPPGPEWPLARIFAQAVRGNRSG